MDCAGAGAREGEEGEAPHPSPLFVEKVINLVKQISRIEEYFHGIIKLFYLCDRKILEYCKSLKAGGPYRGPY